MNDDDVAKLGSLWPTQKKARFDANLKKAYPLLWEIDDFLREHETSSVTKYRTQYFYEYGMTQSVAGRPDEAAEKFSISKEIAKQLGDRLRWCVGQFRESLTLYFGQRRNAMETYLVFSGLEGLWPSQDEVGDEDKGFCKGSEYNLIKRLMELSFEAEAPDFKTRLEALLERERMISGLASSVQAEVHLYAQAQALDAMFDGRYADAIGIYSVLLGYKIPGLNTIPKLKNPDLVRDFGDNQSEELARDYLLMGRALARSDTPDKAQLALTIWRDGTKLPANRGNWRYLTDIDSEIRNITQQAD